MGDVFKAISDPTRRRVLELLSQGPMTAGELSSQFKVSKATMSAHFSILREADLVASDKSGREVVYRLKLSVIEEAVLVFARTLNMSVGQPKEANVHEPLKQGAPG